MKQPRKFYIYSRSSLYFLIFLVAMTLIAIIQLLLEDNFFENLIVLIAALFLLVTVGWILFASMGRLIVKESEIVVDRNFKRYSLDPLTIVVRLGEKSRREGSPIIQFMWKERSWGMGLLVVQLHLNSLVLNGKIRNY